MNEQEMMKEIATLRGQVNYLRDELYEAGAEITSLEARVRIAERMHGADSKKVAVAEAAREHAAAQLLTATNRLQEKEEQVALLKDYIAHLSAPGTWGSVCDEMNRDDGCFVAAIKALRGGDDFGVHRIDLKNARMMVYLAKGWDIRYNPHGMSPGYMPVPWKSE